MDVVDSMREASEALLDLLYNDALLNKSILVILSSLILFLMVYSFVKRIKRQWSSTYFIVLCFAVLFWAVCSLFMVFEVHFSKILSELGLIGILPIPALLCLHIRQQVSYKEQRVIFIILPLVIPVLLIFVLLRDLLFPGLLDILPPALESQWYLLVFYLYAIVCLVRAYLLCFDVLYQMPRRTRRSTRYLLVSITVFVILLALNGLFFDPPPYTITLKAITLLDFLLQLAAPVAFILVLYLLYTAMWVMPASEVIVTSREFVVGSLSTAVIILSRKKRILDWNKSEWGEEYPLPEPMFKEHIDRYRKRILNEYDCRTSPHDDDVIIVVQDGVEKHFYLTTHKAGNKKRVFGFIVEISEVTPLYTLLRKFEGIAYYDHLTKLYNRNAYLERVRTIVKEENMPLLIFVGDVNRLKLINDAYGHLLGDELLIMVADIIRKAMPHNAFVARIGGDEFVMLVPNGSEEMAEAFVRNVITRCSGKHHPLFDSPSISWGYTLMTSADQAYNAVFSEADAIMYHYKKIRHDFHSSGLLPDEEK
ncbi:MAG: diguanylate cyclase [Coriobacteriales bacterium]|jgi:diguanylate cyclase (GGDEF)-like protein|nr:diguanylate cyclase [Coriobacteriales bacterium]